MTGVLFFTAASLVCGLAWSPAVLLAARVVQGVGAAIMTPTALSIISTTFPEGAERNTALGIWGALGGVGATAAWLIGGPLVDGPGWEWIFFINIPLGLAALALSARLLRESRAALDRRSYDPAGALTITGAPVLLVCTLVAAPDVGWGDVQTILLLAGSVMLAVAVTVGAIAAQAAVLKLGFRPVAATGMALMGAGSLLLTQVSVDGSYLADIFFGLLACGPGIGLAFVTATVAALADVAEHESGLASGLSNTALQIGRALGVAIVSTVAVSNSEHFLAANEGANQLVVLNEGFQSAFLAVVVLAGIGMARAPAPRAAPDSAAVAPGSGPSDQYWELRENDECARAHACHDPRRPRRW